MIRTFPCFLCSFPTRHIPPSPHPKQATNEVYMLVREGGGVYTADSTNRRVGCDPSLSSNTLVEATIPYECCVCVLYCNCLLSMSSVVFPLSLQAGVPSSVKLYHEAPTEVSSSTGLQVGEWTYDIPWQTMGTILPHPCELSCCSV